MSLLPYVRFTKITVCSIGSLTAIQGFFLFCFVFVFVFIIIIIFVFEHAANMDSKAVDVSCFIQMISVLSNNHLLL